MAHPTQWEYNNENQARDYQTAWRIARGLPESKVITSKPGRGRSKGKGRRRIPKTYVQDAIGWDAELVNVEKTAGMGNTHAIQNTPECVPYYGMVIDIGPGPNITLPDATSAVTRIGDWNTLPNTASLLGGRGKATRRRRVR